MKLSHNIVKNTIVGGVLFVLGSSLFAAKPTKLIEEITVLPHEISVTIGDSFAEKYFLKNEFKVIYLDTDIDLTTLPKTVISLPFILCVAPIVWASNKTYSINAMDYDLFYALERVRKVFRLLYPEISWSGTIIPDTLIKNESPIQAPSSNVGLLFSGGLDSTASSFAHIDQHQLLITLHGYDVPLGKDTMWKNVIEQSKAFAKTYGHENSFIIFNFYSILKHGQLSRLHPKILHWLAYTSEALSHTGVAAPLLYAKGYKKLLMAASFTPELLIPYGTHPLIDNNISFAGIKVDHDLMADRCEKLALINTVAQQKQLPLPRLRVCWGKSIEGFNCQKCEKCLRTLNEIVAQGFMPEDFGFTLTLGQLKKRTDHFFATKSPLDYDLIWCWESLFDYAHKNCTSGIVSSPLAQQYLQNLIKRNLNYHCKIDTKPSQEEILYYKKLYADHLEGKL